MATLEDDEADIDPVKMILPDEEGEPEKLTTVGDGAASQQVEQHYIRSIESTVVIRQLPSEGLSFQLWPAATTLLGSGTGLVGIAAAVTLGANVTVTDLPHVIPNLKFNADANADVVTKRGGTVDVAPLRWGEDDDLEVIGREFDLVLGSDVVYHDHLFEPLIKTLRLLLNGGTKNRVFVMAHLRRWKKDSVFFKKAKKLFDVEILHTDPPKEGSRIGVVVYVFIGKI
ncbi:hypothetical protein GOBAR_DD07525 [Gossypium barbadense]|nr:hypothetical protein GOBAR_DD07525 [Gossypium barbadense]